MFECSKHNVYYWIVIYYWIISVNHLYPCNDIEKITILENALTLSVVFSYS